METQLETVLLRKSVINEAIGIYSYMITLDVIAL